MLKERVKIVLKIVLFLVCCIVAYGGLRRYFMIKDPGMYFQMSSFYEQEENTVDVVCIGSSHVFCDINPAVFWEEQGITAYDVATSSQLLTHSYYAFKEVLKTQSPKVVVFDVSKWHAGVGESDDNLTNMALFSGMNNSIDRLDAIQTCVPSKDRLDMFLSFPYFHTRYNELTKEDFTVFDFAQYPETGARGYKGFVERFYAVAQEGFAPKVQERPIVLDEETKEYIAKIFDLAEKNGCEVLLVHAPSDKRWEYKEVREIADANGIEYLNYNDLMDEVQLDTATDFIDEGHLNSYGARKMTSHLAQYIKDHFAVESHTGDSRYLSWDENLAYAKQCETNSRLVTETGLGNYFSYFPNPNYTVVLSLVGDYNKENVGQQGALVSCGINEAGYAMGGTCVLDQSGILYYSEMTEDKEWMSVINDSTFLVREDAENGIREVWIDGKDYTVKEKSGLRISNGIDVIVYDNLEHKVVDSVAFDADNGYGIVR